MELIKTDIPEVVILKPAVFGDSRGVFFESYSKEKLNKLGIKEEFVQDNQSVSAKDVIRAFHFQAPPFAQGKLVRVVQGAIIDVAVDIRKNSPTFGKYVSCLLNGDNNLMLWVPVGFAHGFKSLVDNAIVNYKTTNYFHKASEGAIAWNDPDISFPWDVEAPILSEKDMQQPFLKDIITPF